MRALYGALALVCAGVACAAPPPVATFTNFPKYEWANDHRLLVQPTRRNPGMTAFKQPTGEIIGVEADCKKGELLFGYAAGNDQLAGRAKK